MKKKVLIMAGFYLPSVKGGGPIQSIRNIVDNLGDVIDFYILAADRDLGDSKPFSNVLLDEWVKVEKAQVYYTDMQLLNWKKLKTILNGFDFDILYLNSFFAFKDSIIPILLNKIRGISITKIILAPRGQFSEGALGLKKWKKKVFIRSAKFFNLYSNIDWHATNQIEKMYIQGIFGENINVHTVNNLTRNYNTIQFEKNLPKKVGHLKLVYIARIHPMKNLLQVLEILQKTEGNIQLSIYGPIEDKSYWETCQNAISRMKDNVTIKYHGQISNDEVYNVYRENHTAILLTLGENFGHSIAEALIGGCPVIISDRTPWRNLEKYNAGYDISLSNEDELIRAINHFVNMGDEEYSIYSRSAFDYAKASSNSGENINSYIEMFDNSNR